MTVSPGGRRGKGSRGETEAVKLLSGCGWSVRKQPSSGAFGSRVSESRLVGDLVMSCGDERWRCEIKRRAKLPATFEKWQGGNDLLMMRSDHGEWRVSMRSEMFLRLLELAAQALSPI